MDLALMKFYGNFMKFYFLSKTVLFLQG